MRVSAVLIVAGYAALVWQWGWWGVGAAAVHVAVLASTVRR